MKKLVYIVMLVIIVIPHILLSQDIHFAQYEMTPLLINPANAGSFNGDQRVILNYRDQWRTIANPYTTFAVSCDMGFTLKKNTNDFMGVGISVFRDKAGDIELGSTMADLSLSYHIQLNGKSFFTGGLQGGFTQKTINQANMQWGNQYDESVNEYDPNLSSQEKIDFGNVGYGIFAGGILWEYNSKSSYITANNAFGANIGFSTFHINRPKRSFSDFTNDRLHSKYVLHGNISFGIKNTRLAVQPGCLLMMQGSAKELLLGSMFRYILKEESKYTKNIKGAAFSVGVHYRAGDAFVLSSMLEMGSISVGLNYDVNVSALTAVSHSVGGFEIAISYINPNPFFNNKGRSTPKFF